MIPSYSSVLLGIWPELLQTGPFSLIADVDLECVANFLHVLAEEQLLPALVFEDILAAIGHEVLVSRVLVVLEDEDPDVRSFEMVCFLHEQLQAAGSGFIVLVGAREFFLHVIDELERVFILPCRILDKDDLLLFRGVPEELRVEV